MYSCHHHQKHIFMDVSDDKTICSLLHTGSATSVADYNSLLYLWGPTGEPLPSKSALSLSSRSPILCLLFHCSGYRCSRSNWLLTCHHRHSLLKILLDVPELSVLAQNLNSFFPTILQQLWYYTKYWLFS